jgi:hypothetical protein
VGANESKKRSKKGARTRKNTKKNELDSPPHKKFFFPYLMLRDATNNISLRDDFASSSSSYKEELEGTKRGGKNFENISVLRRKSESNSSSKSSSGKSDDDDVRRTLEKDDENGIEEEEEEEEEEDVLARDYTLELLSDEFISEFLFDPSCFDSMRAESERCCGSALEALYPTSVRQMSREGLLQEKSNLKKRLRAYDARLMKMNNIVASKADKKHARPLYARLARVKQQIELLEIRDGLEVLPNLKVAATGTAH